MGMGRKNYINHGIYNSPTHGNYTNENRNKINTVTLILK